MEGVARGFLDSGGGLSTLSRGSVGQHVRRTAPSTGDGAKPICGICDGRDGAEWGEDIGWEQGWRSGIGDVGADSTGSDPGWQRCTVPAWDGRVVASRVGLLGYGGFL